MRIGILGGTGPAGRGLAVRLAAAGEEPVIGSRDPDRAAAVASDMVSTWPDHRLRVAGQSNEAAAACDLVVVATPWDSAVTTVGTTGPGVGGQGRGVDGQRLGQGGPVLRGPHAPRGSVAASIQAALPGSLVSASFHHLPASEMEKLESPVRADVLVCSDHPEASAATVALVDRIDGLRGVDAGNLAQAAPIEAFTAVLITVNIRHKVHATVQLPGLGDR